MNMTIQLMPEILTQHPLPNALHYVNLRLYWGPNSKKWKDLGQLTREKQNYICIACGREVPHKNNDWLELHENFTYDCENKIATIDSMVCLCGKCHKYIHSVNLLALKLEGKVTQEYVDEVFARGDEILAKHNLKKQKMEKELLLSPNWKLLYQGQDLVPVLKGKRR